MARVKVLSWNYMLDYHECQFEDGSKQKIDLQVDGTLLPGDPEELVGKTVEFAYLQPWISLAHGVHVVGELL